MKKQLLLSVLLFVASTISLNAQNIIPIIQKFEVSKEVPTTVLPAPILEQLRTEDALRDKQGLLYRIGVASFVNITTENSGWWTTKENGDRQWQLKIKSEGAEALSFLFEKYKLFGSSTLEIRDLSGKLVHKPLTSEDVQEHFRQHAALCFGDELVLTLTEPKNTTPSEIYMDRVMYNYRSTGNPNAAKINE